MDNNENNPNQAGGNEAEGYKESAPKPIDDLQYIIKDILIPLEKKENFSKHLDKFLNHVKHSLEQVEGKVSLMPINIPSNESDDVLAHNSTYIKKLDKTVDEWSKEIQRTLDSTKVKPEIKTASQEIDHWRRTVSTLSNLAQQLKQDYVRRVKNILDKSEESIKKGNFINKVASFEKDYDDASDYLKFLSTLERSIKDLSSDDLTTIDQSINGIFNNLKIIYLISKHKDQSKFGFLMEVMSKEICDKISEKIKLREIFKHTNKSLELIGQATAIAKKWKNTYLETKKKAKFEYNSQNITGGAEYIIKICEKLESAVKKVKEFLNFLGPELKRVIGGSSQKIDETKEAVIKAYSYIENYPYNIFSRANEESCNKILKNFEDSMSDLEEQTIVLIDETFKELRSAESAYDLYTNFENLISQEKIKKAMKKKYDNILEQFTREVLQFTEIFEKNQENPPISKAKSAVAGKIAWARLLYVKMKRPISKIFYKKNTTGGNVNVIEEGNKKAEELSMRFIEISKKLRDYENNIFQEWENDCEMKFMEYLRNKILAQKGVNRYIVNFDPGLRLLIRNTKFLDLYGFVIKTNIVNIAHKEAQLARYCNLLNQMLKEYDKLMDSLNQQHMDLLKNDIEKLRNCINVGYISHNWVSLGIEEFIKDCNDEIKILRDKANTVFKAEEKIKNILKQIANANLVKELDFNKTSSKEIGQFSVYYEDYRKKIVGELLNRYEEMSGIIKDIEKSTMDSSSKDEKGLMKKATNTKNKLDEYGRNPDMASYYRFWEISLLNALTKAILKAIITFYQLFSMPKQEKSQNILFMIKSKFISPKEILYYPEKIEIDNILTKLVKNFQNTGNDFIRWMKGTCIAPDTSDLPEDKHEIISNNYSYGTCINNNSDIKHYGQKLFNFVHELGKRLDDNKSKFVNEFGKDKFGSWGNQSKTTIEKKLERDRSLKNFQRFLNDMLKYMDEFKNKFQAKKYYDGNYLINNEEIIMKGEDQIHKFMETMLKILANELVEENFRKFNERIENYKLRLMKKIEDSEGLKNVLDDILKIKSKKLRMEIILNDMEEKIHFLELHNYSELPFLVETFTKLKKDWYNLLVKAQKKDDLLITMKRKLAEQTLIDVEVLKKEVEIIYREYNLNGPLTEKMPLKDGLKLLLEYNEKLKVLKEKKDNISVCQRLFNLPATSFNEITEMIENNHKIEPIYVFYKEHIDFREEMSNQLWAKFDIALLHKHSDLFSEKIREFAIKKLKSFSPFKLIEEYQKRFNEELNDIIVHLKSNVINEKNLQGFMKELRKSIEIKFQTLTLKKILDLDLLKEKEKILTFVNDASKENEIKTKMGEVEKIIDSLPFNTKSYKRGNDDKGFIFTDVSEQMAILTENITNVQQLGALKHAQAHKAQINELEQDMNQILEIIEIWIEVQKKWMYLESIFVGSEDIRQKLPDEAKEFDKNDKKFRTMMVSVNKKPSIKSQCKEPNKKSDLKMILKSLEEAEKKLAEHLDSKKNEFSRFYFLTEQDLLQILGSVDPLQTLNTHIVKLYENCTHLITKDKRNIISMVSQEDEVLMFEKPVKMESQQQVGIWMNRVDDEMKSTLQILTKQAIFDQTKEETFKFIRNHIGMVVVFSLECWWTYSLEDVFRRVKDGDKYAMKKELERQSQKLLEYVSIVRKSEINKQDRLKVNNIIIRHVHGREIVDKFVRDSILDMKEFEWESQLKFSWDKKEDNVVIRQCNGSFYSCYEYQGLQGRLVVTPLTDRCIMTLTTALTFYLGGAPAGPAGTGKTETVKDLGKGLGIRVVVQNCTNTLDYLFMGQFFSGLSQTGFWGCFDEFNRINPEVLSVITTQIKNIQIALAQKKDSWILLTKEVKLLPTIGIYITMNPNYEGRSDLPDNLKALFRPITMVTPDRLLICENLLLSEGFNDSRKLAQKIDKLYSLCQEQLSKQHHYDWSLRTIKAVLSSAGGIKRVSPDMNEEVVLMKAMKDMNLPKFIKDDAILFDGLIRDLFPSLDMSLLSENQDVKMIIMQTMAKLKYSQIEAQIQKIMQMNEIMQIRHTTLVCGPPFSGKSCILEVLKKMVEELNGAIVVPYIINPKAQTVPRLYGKKNEISQDFEIGILANIFQVANQPLPPGSNERRWIILDGDIDPIWIENMNSVMDDSKQLTLENKDRILMQKYCAMIIESYNIHHASLATISRLGIIYIDTNILPLNCYFKRWLDFKDPNDWEESTRTNLMDLFDRYVPPTVKYVLRGARPNEEEGKPLKMIIPQYGLSMVRQLCVLLDTILPSKPPSENSQLEPVFIFCLGWSVGACITNEERENFNKFLSKELPPQSTSLIPNIFSCRIDMKTFKTEDWDKAKDIIDDNSADRNIKFNQILVPTQDTLRYSWILGQHLYSNNPCLFVGEPGSGKTVTIQNYLKYITNSPNLPPAKMQKKFVILSTNFSSRTSSLDFQKSLEDILENRGMRTMGPSSGKNLIVFIDDLGMPKVDKYETQEPLAFLKLLIEKKFYYTRDNKERIKLLDTNFICSTLPPGGGNNKIDPRFVTLFSVFNITSDQNAMRKIFSTILNNFFESAVTGENEYVGFAEKLKEATIDVFNKIKANLTRTPIKFHYVFNMRDVSKVFQGFCQIKTLEKFPTKDLLVKLWRNENLRIFQDKLITAEDKKMVNDIISEIISKNFKDTTEVSLGNPCLFGDFKAVKFQEELEDEFDPENPVQKEIRFYEDLGSYDDIREILERCQRSYEKSGNQSMDLVFYTDAIEHLVRIHRILTIEGGNALLVGVGGSGKQSLSRMATFLAKYEMWQIKITSRFDEKGFKEQLVELFRKFKVLEEVNPITFLFTDEQVIDEGFLESINNMLTVGIVPAIFENEEKNQIIDMFKSEAQNKGLGDSKDVVYQYFVSKIKEKLHIILAMSPSGDKLRNRCRNFPGLISNTIVDWFFEWPEDALYSVAMNLLSNYNEVMPELKEKVCRHAIKVHVSVRTYSKKAEQTQKRYIYSTPKNFLDYLKSFKLLYTQYNKEIVFQIERLEKGLEVMADAAEKIKDLRAEVEVEDQKAMEQSIELEKILQELGVSKEENLAKSKKAKETEDYLERKTVEIEIDAKNLDVAVEDQKNINEKVEEAINQMDPKDFDTYAKMTKFDSAMGQFLKCFYFAIMEVKPPKWDNIQDSEVSSLLGKGLALKAKIGLNNLKKLGDELPPKQLAEATRIMNELKKKNEQLLAGSKSLRGISSWVIYFEQYATGSSKLDALNNQLKQKLDEQERAKKGLAETKVELEVLKKKLDELILLNEQKEQLFKETKEKLESYRKTLSAATELFTGLSSEKVRWSSKKESLGISKEKLIGDCLLASSFLSYSGPFSFENRKQMIYQDWKQDIKDNAIPITEEFNLQSLLVTDQIISQWNLEGLPDDELSVQNGILTTKTTTRWPLCIDPEMQAITWIKQKKHDGFKAITFSTPNYIDEIKRAIKIGAVILIENVGETLDPNLDSVLDRNYKVIAGIPRITVSGEPIDVDLNFKLYMTTKLSSPHYTPEVMGKTMVINYSVTMDGLEDQLLNEVVRHEYPDLEERRKQLVEKMNISKISLKKLEDELLGQLTDSSDTNILKNEPLIMSLKNTKKTSVEVELSLENSVKTKEDIDQQRNNYKPVAKRGSILYFAMTALRLISPMYEYSLGSYMGVYRNALDEAKPDQILNNRLENFKRKLTQLVYEYTCYGVFEKHKVMFSFHMRTMIMRYEENLDAKEMDFFLRGNPSIQPSKEKKSIAWLSDLSWKDMERLITLNDVFRPFLSDVLKHQQEWKDWFDLEKPEDVPLPNEYDKKITLFQKLLIVRVFRQDRIYNAIKNFIKNTIGEFFINPPTLNDKIFNQSNERTPILFVLTPGVDPMAFVSALAGKKGFLEKKFRYMSLGQKQEKEATDMIQDGVKRGLWILLQNCDLLKNWLKDLEVIIDNIKNPKPDFRLWLTTAPIPDFPIGILQKSFKIVYEPPDGLMANMVTVYNSITEESLENDSSHDAFKPLTFTLAFFHSVLQERKKFGKIGWNVAYDFNMSDYTVSKRLLAMYLNKCGKDDVIPWASLKYLIGEAMYGGRVTDDFDRRLMMTYLNEYMGDFIFDTNQKFFFSKIGFDYEVPANTAYDGYLKYIESIPNTYSPEVIGLHSNAEIDYFTQASLLLWTNLIVLQKSSGSESGEKAIDMESFVKDLSTNIRHKLPQKFDIQAVNRKFQIKTPIQAVLVQELERFNLLLDKMDTSLSDLNKAISGEIALNAEIEEIMLSLFNGFIPTSWKNLAPETQKTLGDWIIQFFKRYNQYDDWEKNGEPKVMWLPGLHIPASYLKAIIQVTSRKKLWPLDKTDTYTVVTKYYSPDEVKEKPEFGCYISGLYLEGAEWDSEKNCLERQKPKKLICEMPLIQIIPAEAAKIKLRNNLRTPVYMTQNRRNVRGEGLVFEADLRTLEHPNKWILQGVCLVLNTYIG